ncbi:hypothetical protein Tco_0699631 [Tanacetum coccineum]
MSNKTNKEGQITLHYPMLSRSNYAAWAIKMKMDKMALAAIYQRIPEDMLLVKTARVQTLKAEFEVLSIKETESVDEFATKLSNVVSNIRALGDKIKKTYVVKKLLRAVPSKFLQISSTIDQFGDLDHMSVEEVVGRLKTHEERIKGHVEADEKRLLLTHQEWSERKKKQSADDSKSGIKNYRGSSSYSRGRGRGRGRGNGSRNRGGRGRGGGNQQRDGYCLFFRLQPDHSLATMQLEGKKTRQERLKLLLFAEMIRSERTSFLDYWEIC